MATKECSVMGFPRGCPSLLPSISVSSRLSSRSGPILAAAQSKSGGGSGVVEDRVESSTSTRSMRKGEAVPMLVLAMADTRAPPHLPDDNRIHDSILDLPVDIIPSPLERDIATAVIGKGVAGGNITLDSQQEAAASNRSSVAWIGDVWGFLSTKFRGGSKEDDELEQSPQYHPNHDPRDVEEEEEEEMRPIDHIGNFLKRRRHRKTEEEQEEEEDEKVKEKKHHTSTKPSKMVANGRADKRQAEKSETGEEEKDKPGGIDWGGIFTRVKSSSKDTWTAIRAKVPVAGSKASSSSSPSPTFSERLTQQIPSSLRRNATSGGKPFLPSLLQRVDPSAYAGAWGRAFIPEPRPDELYKLPSTPGEAWDLFVDDVVYFFDAVARVCMPQANLPDSGPRRPQVGAVRPKAARVRKGPLNAAPLVLRSKNYWSAPAYERAKEEKKKVVSGSRDKGSRNGTVSENAGGWDYDDDEEEDEENLSEQDWESIRGQVRKQLEEQDSRSPRAVRREGGADSNRGSDDGSSRVSYRGEGGVASEADYQQAWTEPEPAAAVTIEETPAAYEDLSYDPFAPSIENYLDQPWMTLPPQLPATSSASASEEIADGEVERRLPGWLGKLSITKAILRPPTPAQMKEIIRRRQLIRRMPRKMDDNFLRTVSRKLQGDPLRIREFQLQTDRYRNSLISANVYYDSVIMLFGYVKDADEVIVPLISLLPEASKRKGLSETYRARKEGKIAAGQSENSGQGVVGAVRGWVSSNAKGVSILAKGLFNILTTHRIELSVESDEEEKKEVRKKTGRLRAGEIILGGGKGGGLPEEVMVDDPMTRLHDVIGDRDADFLEMRTHLYKRGAILAIDLYRTAKRLCESDASLTDEVVDLLLEELEGLPDKAMLLKNVHEGQRKAMRNRKKEKERSR